MPTQDSDAGEQPGQATMAGPVEELRLAVVLNGGVSLAIWMGGVAHEIDRLAKAGSRAYVELLAWAGSTARVDVITGTSAGGINGAALALSTCNRNSKGLGELRDTWMDSGSIARLLREPFRGSPPSLLQGDEFFLPELTRAMHGLTANYSHADVGERPMDLAITCTLLNGVPTVVTDAAGQPVGQVRHDGLFRFQRGPSHRNGPTDAEGLPQDDFADSDIDATADALALAARTTASYPVAFEPSLIPTPQGDEVDLAGRPNMLPFVSGAWDDTQGGPQTRYAVDGGVLANTPTRPALEAIDRMPVSGPVRRVVLLVHPHAPRPGQDKPDSAAPTLVKMGGSLMKAIMSQGSRNYVDEIGRHNQLAAGRRHLRADVVLRTPPDEILERAAGVRAWYWAKRRDRIARDLSTIWANAKGEADPRPVAAIAAQIRESMTQIPESIRTEEWPQPASRGFEGALGVADTATDYLKRRCWVDADPRVNRARAAVSECRDDLLRRRSAFTKAVKERIGDDRDLDSWVRDVRTMYETSAGTDLNSTIVGIAAALSGLPTLPEVTNGGTSLQSGQDTELLERFHVLLGLDRGATAETVRRRLQDLDTISYVLCDEVTTGASLPVDLVQLTFNVNHPFAPALSGEQKVAGDLVGRFSGFLKRSWRVNDWAWGRLDAIETLCRVVLDPDRVRHYLALSASRGQTAETLVDKLYDTLFPQDRGDWPESLPDRDEVKDDLGSFLSAASDDAARCLDRLHRVFATRLALDVATDDLPVLVDAVGADVKEGANERALGTVAVQANASTFKNAEGGSPAQQWEALRAFGRTGIGQEALRGETSSDQMIATIAKSAAVAINLADSDTSGLGFAKPVTSGLRGAALLPYWAITGLTSTGRLARALAIGALAAGGVLLALGLFGLGPSWGVAVGAGAVLAVLAYSALRTGTVLHGALLLLPAVGFLAWAGYRYQDTQAATAGGGDPPATTDVGVLVAVLGLAAGLALLGAVRSPLASPQAWVSTPRRWIPLAAGVVLLVLAGSVLQSVNPDYALELRRRLSAAYATAVDAVPVAVWVGLLLAVLASGVFSWWVGVSWRLVVRTGPGTWAVRKVDHPAGVTAGWSWVYGVVVAAIAVVLLSVNDFGMPATTAGRAALVALLVSSAVLLLPVPLTGHLRARRATNTRVTSVLASAPEASPRERLLGAGLSYRYLLRPVTHGEAMGLRRIMPGRRSGNDVALTWRANRLSS